MLRCQSLFGEQDFNFLCICPCILPAKNSYYHLTQMLFKRCWRSLRRRLRVDKSALTESGESIGFSGRWQSRKAPHCKLFLLSFFTPFAHKCGLPHSQTEKTNKDIWKKGNAGAKAQAAFQKQACRKTKKHQHWTIR